MEKYKLLIIVHPELAPGFRLAGVDVLEVKDTEDASDAINEILVHPSNFGLIAISEDFVADFDDRTRKKIEDSDVPLIVPFPVESISSWRRLKKGEDYVTALIQSSMGYRIKLKRE